MRKLDEYRQPLQASAGRQLAVISGRSRTGICGRCFLALLPVNPLLGAQSPAASSSSRHGSNLGKLNNSSSGNYNKQLQR